jgi:hypothetical protein
MQEVGDEVNDKEADDSETNDDASPDPIRRQVDRLCAYKGVIIGIDPSLDGTSRLPVSLRCFRGEFDGRT